jgi:CRP-like cAMP-binding protein
MCMDKKQQAISRVPLFEGLSKRAVRQVSAVADEIDLPAGTALTREGRWGKEFVVLVDGVADVEQGGELVNTLGPGDFLGEIALVTGERRTATVTTRSPAKVLVMNTSGFRALLDDEPTLKQRVVATAALRAV